MTLFTAALAVAGITVASVSTEAHVAPSVDDNNRYLKVTPMRGGFRLAYTVFFGEIPGASERKLVDTNRDGRIDEGEAKRFGENLAGQVAASLELDLSGAAKGGAGGGAAKPRSIGQAASGIQWKVVDVGLGNASVAVGSFSVDMIAYVCAPRSTMVLRDSFRIPRPGETEVVVEDSPGVTVKNARIGASDDPRRDWRFLGPGGPLSDDGVEVTWTAEPTAPELPGGCAAASAANGGSGSRRLPFIVGAVVVACAAVGGVIVGRKLRRGGDT